MTYRRQSEAGISYTIRGEGPIVVLLHGWCLSGETWRYQEHYLAQDFTVVVPDLPGFGRSDHLGGDIAATRHAHELHVLLGELGGRAAHVVGFAYGAMVAMTWAVEKPDDVASLAVIGVPSASTAPYDRMPRAMLRDWPTFAVRSAEGICKSGASPATLDWLARVYMSTPLRSALAGVEELGQWEPFGVAAAVVQPTLVLHGADDTVVPPDVGRRTAAALARGSFVVVEGAAHLVPVDAPEQLSRLVEDFVWSVDR